MEYNNSVIRYLIFVLGWAECNTYSRCATELVSNIDTIVRPDIGPESGRVLRTPYLPAKFRSDASLMASADVSGK